MNEKTATKSSFAEMYNSSTPTRFNVVISQLFSFWALMAVITISFAVFQTVVTAL